jgi:hypothetical protein
VEALMWSHQVTDLLVIFGPLSTGLVAIVRWGKSTSSCSVVRAVVFTKWQLRCPSAATLFGQLLLQQGGAIRFEWCPLSHKISSGIYHLPHFGRLACDPSLISASPCLLWEVGLSPHSCSQPLLL